MGKQQYVTQGTLGAIQAASDPRSLYIALVDHFKATGDKAPNGEPYRMVTTNIATEIATVGGRQKWSLRDAYIAAATAKGFTGNDLDPRAVCEALVAEGELGERFFAMKSRRGWFHKVFRPDPNYVKAQKPNGNSGKAFGL